MDNLTGYLADGQAEIAAYNLDNGNYALVGRGPCADWGWDAHHQVFVFWWAGDDRPHGFHVQRVADNDYLATLYHATGKLELAPLVTPREQQRLADWQRRKPATVTAQLTDLLATLVAETAPAAAAVRAARPYTVLLEYQRPVGGVAGDWTLVGAWAAAEDEIGFWAKPAHAGLSERWQAVIRDALTRGFTPAAILDYWEAAANGQTTLRTRLTVSATSAAAAAQQAIAQAETVKTTGAAD